MSGLGLTLLPNLQHQDGDHPNNDGSSIPRGRTVCPLHHSPLSGSPLQSIREQSLAGRTVDREAIVSVSLPLANETSPPLTTLQNVLEEDLSAHARSKRTPNSVHSHGRVLASPCGHCTLPKPHRRYPSSSNAPPLSHNGLSSPLPYSLCERDGGDAHVERVPSLTVESFENGSNGLGTSRDAQCGDGPLSKAQFEPDKSMDNSSRQDGSLNSGEGHWTADVRGDAEREQAAEANHILPAPPERKESQNANSTPSRTTKPVLDDKVDLAPSDEEQTLERRVKEREPEAPRSSQHSQRRLDTKTAWGCGYNSYKALNHKDTHPNLHDPPVMAELVRTVVLPEYKSPSPPPLNPKPDCEPARSDIFYLPSAPILHSKLVRHPPSNPNPNLYHKDIQHPASSAMATSNNWMPAMNIPYDRQQYVASGHFNTQYPRAPAPPMPSSSYQVPAMGTYSNPQYHNGYPANSQVMTTPQYRGATIPPPPFHLQYYQYNNTPYPGFTAMPNPNQGVPSIATPSHPHHSHYPHFSGYPTHSMPPPTYQAAPAAMGMHQNPPNPGPNYQVGPMVTAPPRVANPAPWNPASGYVDPALLVLAGLTPPAQNRAPVPGSTTNQPPVTIDLTNDDDDDEGRRGKEPGEVAECGSGNPPVTTTEQQLPKEATPPPPKPKSFKRNYAWLQQAALLPDMPHSKKQKLSAQEDAYRQQYETRAANSTANYFLGLKPTWATEDVPLFPANLSSSVGAPSTSSSSTTSSSAMTKGAQRKGEEKAEVAANTKERRRRKAGVAKTRKGKSRERPEEKDKAERDGHEDKKHEEVEERNEQDEDAAFAAEIEAAFDDEDDKAEKEGDVDEEKEK